MKTKRLWASYSICILLLFAVVLLSLCWGSYAISLDRICSTLLGNGTNMEQVAVFTLRLPRICIALLIGSALALSGGLLQSVTKNDLADSGILGINAGASLAAVLFIFGQGTLYYQAMQKTSILALPIVALIGAFASAGLIYLISSRKGIRPQRLLLTGIGVNIAINALISFITFKGSAGDYNRVLVWTSGSLWGSSWTYVIAILPIILLVIGAICYHHKTLDILTLGDEVATGLGVHVGKARKRFLCYAVLLAGSATAVAGNISFLGLLGPHIAKTLVGYKHKHSLLLSMVISSILIVFADSLSRNVFSPLEIPVGITISLIGVPYFIYLMIKETS